MLSDELSLRPRRSFREQPDASSDNKSGTQW